MDIPIPEFSREQIPRFPHEKELRSIAAKGMPLPFTRGEKMILTGLRAIREAIEAQKKDEPKEEPAKPPVVTYSLTEAAKYLGMSQRKLREMVKARKIACTRSDYRNFLFTEADLKEYLTAYRTKPKRI